MVWVDLAEIHLNLKSARFWSKSGDNWFRGVLKWLAKHPPSFNIFWPKGNRVLVKFLFSNIVCRNNV
jgi:hypothetical protein